MSTRTFGVDQIRENNKFVVDATVQANGMGTMDNTGQSNVTHAPPQSLNIMKRDG